MGNWFTQHERISQSAPLDAGELCPGIACCHSRSLLGSGLNPHRQFENLSLTDGSKPSAICWCRHGSARASARTRTVTANNDEWVPLFGAPAGSQDCKLLKGLVDPRGRFSNYFFC